MIPPTLTTDRLVLRRFREDDAARVLVYAQDDLFGRYIPDVPYPYQSEHAAQHIADVHDSEKDDKKIEWAIDCLGTLIGSINFHEINRSQHRCAVGYALDKAYWGQGLASEALRCALNFAFTELDMRRIEALVYVGNAASVRVLEKAGFQHEGVRRSHATLRGNRSDANAYSLLREEWT